MYSTGFNKNAELKQKLKDKSRITHFVERIRS